MAEDENNDLQQPEDEEFDLGDLEDTADGEEADEQGVIEDDHVSEDDGDLDLDDMDDEAEDEEAEDEEAEDEEAEDEEALVDDGKGRLRRPDGVFTVMLVVSNLLVAVALALAVTELYQFYWPKQAQRVSVQRPSSSKPKKATSSPKAKSRKARGKKATPKAKK